MNVTSRPSGAIAPRWSQFAIRPVGSSRTVTGSDQVAPPSAERRWTTRWNHLDASRYGLFDSMLRTRRPSARRRTALVSDGGPMSSGIGTIRHGVQVRPASSGIGQQDRHRQAALGLGVEERLARERLAVDPQRGDDQVVAVEPRDRGGLQRSAPAVDGRLERRHRLRPRPAAVGRAAQLDVEVVGVLAAADAVGDRAGCHRRGRRRPGRWRTPATCPARPPTRPRARRPP